MWSEREPQLERVFNNRYRIENRLGSGGMALVYSGTDTLLRRRVAIKVLREQYAVDDDFVRRFSYEAQAAAKLSHPNIVNIYDFGTEDHAYFIVMELVDGATLAEIIAGDGVIPEAVAIEYAIQIASGLAFAHRAGLLHRDIKPANILITADDVVKISDFGIARAVSDTSLGVTQPGMVMGSVYYLSPEQAQGLPIDETSDLYSVGVVLYQMLTGGLPFDGDSPVSVALKHVSNAAPGLDPASGVSPALGAVVERLLRKNPRERFGSATELAAALREARERPDRAATIPAAAAGPAVPQPPPRPSAAPDRPGAADDAVAVAPRRGAGIARAAVLVLLLVAAAVTGYLAFGRGKPPPPLLMADYTGRTVNAAEEDLASHGITPSVSQTADSAVPANHVVRQTPPAGTPLATNAPVALVVSSGPPPVAVPAIVGFTVEDAQRALAAVTLRSKVVSRYGPEPKGQVIAASPTPGKDVRENTVVTLTVSRGLQPATVPNVVSMTLDDAKAALRAAGLRLAVVDKESSDAIAAGTVMSQAQSAGTQLDRGSTVDVTLSTGPTSSSVPDVGAKTPDAAAGALRAAGFTPVITYNVDPTNAGGTVTAQQPAPGTSAKRGSNVTVFIGVPGTVPDVAGLTLDAAKDALQKNGYESGNVAFTSDCVGAPAGDTTPCPADDGKVVRTEPEANKDVKPGEAVTIYVHRSDASPAP